MEVWKAVNLGQSLGELQLRIMELEEQLGIEPNARPVMATVIAAKRKTGVLRSIRALLSGRPDGPLTIDEMSEQLVQFPRALIARNVHVAASQGRLKRFGSGFDARFGLPS